MYICAIKPKMKKPIKINKAVDKKLLIASIRKALDAIDLPQEIQLDHCSRITDAKKFFKSHLLVVENTEGRIQEPSAERLKKALSLVGIDVKALAGEIQLNSQKIKVNV